MLAPVLALTLVLVLVLVQVLRRAVAGVLLSGGERPCGENAEAQGFFLGGGEVAARSFAGAAPAVPDLRVWFAPIEQAKTTWANKQWRLVFYQFR